MGRRLWCHGLYGKQHEKGFLFGSDLTLWREEPGERKKMRVFNFQPVWPSQEDLAVVLSRCLLEGEQLGVEREGRITVCEGGWIGDVDRGWAKWSIVKMSLPLWQLDSFQKETLLAISPSLSGQRAGEAAGGAETRLAPWGMFPLNKQLWTMSTFCTPWHSPTPSPQTR